MENIRTAAEQIKKGDFMIKIDVKKAYYHVNIAEESRDLLRFMWGERHMRYTCLPMGLATAPWIFTKIMREVARYLRRVYKLRIAVYMDDILIIGATREIAIESAKIVAEILQELGFVINKTKSILVPATKREFLGIIINTKNLTFEIPESKIQKIKQQAKKLAKKKIEKIRKVASFLGLANSIEIAMPHQKLKTREILRRKNEAVKKQGWQGEMEISEQMKEELKWWQNDMEKCATKKQKQTKSTLTITTDASKHGWGAHTNKNQSTYGRFTNEESNSSSNQRELTAASTGIRTFAKNGDTIRLLTDNITTRQYINNQGGKIEKLSRCAEKLLNWCMDMNITITAEFIKGVNNNLADKLSRMKRDKNDWMLNPAIFQILKFFFFEPDIDAFATFRNNQTKRFWSFLPDPECEAIDAFNQVWHDKYIYANPPFNQITKVINKLSENPTPMILITPWWTSTPWFQQIQKIMIQQPIIIQNNRSTFLPGARNNSPWKQSKWKAAAWYISKRNLDNQQQPKYLKGFDHNEIKIIDRTSKKFNIRKLTKKEKIELQLLQRTI